MPHMVFGQAWYILVIMQKYNHLDLQDRHKIHALLEAGHSIGSYSSNTGMRNDHDAITGTTGSA
ncbi:hypothetical protein SAMN06265219_104122 [Gracilimonas mengyeensis]|uniref:Uncharacterized protein n=1 Tax=Gracilimonas mengyeensis TaxID=1302730 RepID=A0A521C3E5_9BACT|nr:hypothetical protein SAMN06265219_104122 [Gracilimonas mengyeensis]